MNIYKERVEIYDQNLMMTILGKLDENLKFIEKLCFVKLSVSDTAIDIFSKQETNSKLCAELIENLKYIITRQRKLDTKDIKLIYDLIKTKQIDEIKDVFDEVVVRTASGKSIRPKTIGQIQYVNSMKKNDIVFGVGPAGTGKTYLAMAMAVNAFKKKEVSRIILTRPAVEAGESLGFLPGDLQMKVDPYLRPLYDALFEIMGFDNFNKLVENNVIEVAPLAYMRGRTLDSSYVILDEAQNTTNEQMKMFLTRLGYGSKAIITGDITQIDLPGNKQSGLKTVTRILKDIKGLDIIYLTKNDIVRHALVQNIIDAYERYEKEKNKRYENKSKKKT
ncbi:MAG: PhoH family protein [Tissierellia bacterium]|nr:PhoH family protein [Tissierellia bacterium]